MCRQSYQAFYDLFYALIYDVQVEKARLRKFILGQLQSRRPAFW
jgi:hypothetical protein